MDGWISGRFVVLRDFLVMNFGPGMLVLDPRCRPDSHGASVLEFQQADLLGGGVVVPVEPNRWVFHTLNWYVS